MGNCWWLHPEKAAGDGEGDAGRRGTLSPPPPPQNSTHPLGPKKMNETKYTIPYTHANPRVCVQVRERESVCVDAFLLLGFFPLGMAHAPTYLAATYT